MCTFHWIIFSVNIVLNSRNSSSCIDNYSPSIPNCLSIHWWRYKVCYSLFLPNMIDFHCCSTHSKSHKNLKFQIKNCYNKDLLCCYKYLLCKWDYWDTHRQLNKFLNKVFWACNLSHPNSSVGIDKCLTHKSCYCSTELCYCMAHCSFSLLNNFVRSH